MGNSANTNQAGISSEGFAAGRPVGDEADALDLANVVEADDSDVSLRVRLLGLLHLLQHLS